jgi:dihydroxy-acid dehydratase
MHACPGAGACGGMYTANTMSAAIETLGMSLPQSSSIPAVTPARSTSAGRAGEPCATCWSWTSSPARS